jgi:hypothetical protein
MRTPRLEVVRFLGALIIVPMAGCGKETVNIPDTTPPQVSSTTPAEGTTTVALNTTISATFSKPMNPSTISATSFLVAGPGGAPVAGTVTYAAAGSVQHLPRLPVLPMASCIQLPSPPQLRTRPVRPILSQLITCGRLPASPRPHHPRSSPRPPRPGPQVCP